MEFKDYYQTLGLKRDATQDEIKRAYRRMARKYHPDVSKEDNAEAHFKDVQEAYEVLKDPEKRSAYDQFGKDWKAGQEFHPPPDYEPGFEFHGGGFTNDAAFSEFFESLFGRSRDHGRAAGSGYRARGQDQHAQILVDLEDAFHGAVRSLTLSAPEWDANGHVREKQRQLKVKIPVGVTEGQRIRLAGQGNAGIGGGPNGDLYLQISFQPHRLYRAVKRDIYLDLPITPWEAALGRAVKVPTLGGAVDLRVPAGSQSGAKLRLKGRGLPGKPAGDQFVVLKIVTPVADSQASKDFYERMEKELPLNPRAALEV